jgi:hypothetical protein
MYYIKSILTSIALTASCFVSVSNAGVIFFDDFEDGSLVSSPSYSAIDSGIIVSDPLESDNALSFNDTGGSLDSLTMTSITGNVFLSFDYLGTCGALSGGCGGYLLLPQAGNNWLGTSTAGNNWGYVLTDDNTWNHYEIFYTATTFNFRVMDWSGVGDGIAGDAYFDNIRFSDTGFATSLVPEPASIALFALGLLGLTSRKLIK